MTENWRLCACRVQWKAPPGLDPSSFGFRSDVFAGRYLALRTRRGQQELVRWEISLALTFVIFVFHAYDVASIKYKRVRDTSLRFPCRKDSGLGLCITRLFSSLVLYRRRTPTLLWLCKVAEVSCMVRLPSCKTTIKKPFQLPILETLCRKTAYDSIDR